MALVVLCVQILLPGIGAMVAAYADPRGCNYLCFFNGFMQLILVPIFVGLVWSIFQGVAIYQKSNNYYAQQPW